MTRRCDGNDRPQRKPIDYRPEPDDPEKARSFAMKNVLLVCSADTGHEPLRGRLEAQGHEVMECNSVRESTRLLGGRDALVLAPSQDDASILSRLRDMKSLDSQIRVILIDEREPPDAGSASEGGSGASNENGAPSGSRLRAASSEPLDAELVGESPTMLSVKETIRQLGQSPFTSVLVTGESGTGKDLVARAIHLASGARGPFVHVACAALPAEELEIELFGCEASASPERKPRAGLIERAEQGTLFLDEIAALPDRIQSKLMAFAEDKVARRLGGTADVASQTRLVAATNRDVRQCLRDGVLRSDFLYRVAVLSVELPPLRVRKSDMPLLVDRLLAQLSRQLGKNVTSAAPSAIKLLGAHAWPGNVRELRNVLERAVLHCQGQELELKDISLPEAAPAVAVDYRLPPQGIDFRELERAVVTQALALAHNNQTRAASLLGMTRDQIRYRMAKFGMTSQNGGSEQEHSVDLGTQSPSTLQV
jgi:two-component system, NtrC family, response regulator AtoC